MLTQLIWFFRNSDTVQNTNEGTAESFQFSLTVLVRNLALPGRILHLRISVPFCHWQNVPGWVEQSLSVHRGTRGARESVHTKECPVVHFRVYNAARFRNRTYVSISPSTLITIILINENIKRFCCRGLSTRMLASAWWFFCLIIVALYTANLAAFLVFDTPVKPIKSAEDLAALNGAIKYGAKRGGSTFNFFKVSLTN